MKFNKNFKSWVNNLLDEGYDLSDYSIDEMYEVYLSEMGTVGGNLPGNTDIARRARIRQQQQAQAALTQARGINLRGATSGASQGTGYATTYGGRQGIISRGTNPIVQSGRGTRQSAVSAGRIQPVNVGGRTLYPAQRGKDVLYLPSREAKPSNLLFKRQDILSGKVKNEGKPVIYARNTSGSEQAVTVGKRYKGGKAGYFVYDAQGKRTVVPKLKEEFEYWVDSLHEDGYDLSNYTWEGLFEYYCDNILSEVNGKTNLAFSSNSLIAGKPLNSNVRFPSTSLRASSSNLFSNKSPRLTGEQTPMDKYKSQIKTGDIKGAEKTGMDIWRASNPKLAAAADERQRTRGTSATTNPQMSGFRLNPPSSPSASATSAAYNKSTPQLSSGLNTSSQVKFPSSTSSNLQNAFTTNLNTTSSPTSIKKPNRSMGSSKPGSTFESYDFARPNRIATDMHYLYQSIYEGQKVDQDQDGDNDFADVRIARMIASGMSREEAIRKTRKKSYNKESYDLDQLAILYLMQEGYAKDLRSAQAIYENASSEFKQNLQEIAPAVVAAARI